MGDPNFWKRIDRLTAEDLDDLKAAGPREKTQLDLKEFDRGANPIVREKASNDICAMANGGGGRLIYGAVEDEAEGIQSFQPIHISQLKPVRSTLRNAAHAISPPPLYEVQDVRYPNSDSDSVVLVVDVKPTQSGPHQHQGKYWTRSGDGKTFMPHSSVVQAVLAQHANQTGRSWNPVGTGAQASGKALQRNSERKPGWWLSIDLYRTPSSSEIVLSPVGSEVSQLADQLHQDGWQVERGQIDIFASKNTGAPQEIRFAFTGDARWSTLLADSTGVPAIRSRLASRLKHLAERLSFLIPATDMQVIATVMPFGAACATKFSLMETVDGRTSTFDAREKGLMHSAKCWQLRSVGELLEEQACQDVAKEVVELLLLDLDKFGSMEE